MISNVYGNRKAYWSTSAIESPVRVGGFVVGALGALVVVGEVNGEIGMRGG